MKAGWFVVALTALAGVASAVPQMPPPIERDCMGPWAWGRLQSCFDRVAPGTKVSTLSSDVKAISTRDRRQYLYLRFGAGWRLVYEMGDADYELLRRGTLLIRDRSAIRIDLGHHVDLGTNGMLVERVTLVCPDAQSRCRALVTACTMIVRGRAVETFRGELVVTDEDVNVVGDRSYSGAICRGR